jgi:hypothetical protein
MRKFVRWDDDDVINQNRLRMPDDVIAPVGAIGLDEAIVK